MTRVGRWTASTNQAVVADLPVPVAPRSTVSCSPALTRRARSAIAAGWSPAGWKSETTWKGARRRWRSVVGRMSLRYAEPPTAGRPERAEVGLVGSVTHQKADDVPTTPACAPARSRSVSPTDPDRAAEVIHHPPPGAPDRGVDHLAAG